MPAVVNWDEVERERAEVGELASWTTDLGTAAGSDVVGVTRWEIDPGKRSTPAHAELEEEEIFFVLGGSGVSWQDGTTYEVGAGDCLVHRVAEAAHTLRAGPDGLDVLAFGMRAFPGATYLPRAGVVRMPGVALAVAEGPHPWEREAAAGELDFPAPSARPASIVNLADVELEPEHKTTVSADWRDLGHAAGSVRTGLQHVTVTPERISVAPHCHAAEEEVFVVLAGEGTLKLIPAPTPDRRGEQPQEHPVRAGSVVARPAGTKWAHTFRAGADGLTLLAYGTREPNEIIYYPRSGKIFFGGVGLIARLESLDYWDGED